MYSLQNLQWNCFGEQSIELEVVPQASELQQLAQTLK